MATPYIRPFRDVSEHFIVNLYTWSGTIPTAGVPRGTFVKIGSGWMADQNLQDAGAVGNFNPTSPQAFSRRYKIPATVGAIANSGDAVLGLTLYEVREVDENNLPLVFNKQKQAQLQAVLSGESIPVATKGIFLYSGVNGTPAAGATAYINSNGTLDVGSANCTATKVGRFLGPKDSKGWVLFQLDLPY